MSVAPLASPSDHSNMIMLFRAGVTACLRSWSALRTAVESGWGGSERECHLKAEDLRASILDHIARLSQDDLEDNLAIYMEEEFSVVLEDNSERQIADTIYRLYEECCTKGNTQLALQVIQSSEQAASTLAAIPNYNQPQIQSNEFDDDDDEDMMDADHGDHGVRQQASISTSAVAPGIPAAAAAAAVLHPGTTTATTAPVLVDLSAINFNASEYASQPLFGKVAPTATGQNQQPARQLGDPQQGQQEQQPMVDEDGFAPVVKPKRKSNRNKPV